MEGPEDDVHDSLGGQDVPSHHSRILRGVQDAPLGNNGSHRLQTSLQGWIIICLLLIEMLTIFNRSNELKSKLYLLWAQGSLQESMIDIIIVDLSMQSLYIYQLNNESPSTKVYQPLNKTTRFL